MCYLHCFGHKCKPQHCAGHMKKVASTPTRPSVVAPITWALPGRLRVLFSSFSFENQKFLFLCLFSDLYNRWGRTLKRLKVFFSVQIWGWHLASMLCRLPLGKRKCYSRHKDHLPTRFQDCDAKPGKWEFLKENIYRLLTQTTIYTFSPRFFLGNDWKFSKKNYQKKSKQNHPEASSQQEKLQLEWLNFGKAVSSL